MGSVIIIFLLLVCVARGLQDSEVDKCGAYARIETGWVRGAWRVAENGRTYASFRGIPYAKQPLGHLRFKELQPEEPWEGVLPAIVEGPVCPYHDMWYRFLQQPRAMGEDCIRVNVHVPEAGLSHFRSAPATGPGLPVVVLVHGGGWLCGSGDSDVHGPEYLVGEDVLVVTFNFRLDMFGFLSLGTAKIPGNNGLRDMVTLLRWVQRNIGCFGGNPDNVTLVGQSAGASSVHLLSLSPAAKGLFNKIWLMSGTAYPSFFSTSPAFAKQLATSYLTILGLNGTDHDTVHDILVRMPLARLREASGKLLSQTGIISFMPVVEASLKGVTPILTGDPATLLANGFGKDIPLVIGFANNEGQTLKPRMRDIDVLGTYKKNPLAVLSPHDVITLSPSVTAKMSEKVANRYFGEEPTLDEFAKMAGDSFFAYPSLKLARTRAQTGGAPVYFYQFGYTPTHGVLRTAFNLKYPGSAHGDDLTFTHKINSFPVPYNVNDDNMRIWMTGFLANYAKIGHPAPSAAAWPKLSSGQLSYQKIVLPMQFQYTSISAQDRDILAFFDTLPDV